MNRPYGNEKFVVVVIVVVYFISYFAFNTHLKMQMNNKMPDLLSILQGTLISLPFLTLQTQETVCHNSNRMLLLRKPLKIILLCEGFATMNDFGTKQRHMMKFYDWNLSIVTFHHKQTFVEPIQCSYLV